MRDLDLWRRIGDATARELHDIAGWPLGRRAAYLAGAVALTEHTDPEIRAAALYELAGVRGVPGVRAIVARLDDDHERVRTAAVEALRLTARDAPVRFAHALFHPRVDVRRAALSCGLPGELGAIALRLRADPACADLAAKIEWPDHALPLAIDLYVGGHVPATELCVLIARTAVNEVRKLIDSERRRAGDIIDPVLERGARVTGGDVLDDLFAAIAEAGNERALDTVMAAVVPKKTRALARRAAVALLEHLTVPSLAGACAALEPRIVERLSPELASAAASGLARFKWPVKPTVKQVETLLALPISRGNLALATALAGLLPAKRVPTLAKLFGSEQLLASLLAGNDGWKIMCLLPREKPALDVMLLQQLEAKSPERYVELAGIAIGIFAGERLEDFVKAVPRKYRERAFAVALLSQDDTEADRLARIILPRLDRAGLAGLLAAVLDRPMLVRAVVRASDAKPLVAAVLELAPATVARIVEILDTGDPPPRDRELALSSALILHPEPSVRAWSKKVSLSLEPTILVSAPVPRVRRALTSDEQRAIITASTRDLPVALAPAFAAPVTGLVYALATRAPQPSVAACSALLGCADPLDDVARQLDRFAAFTDQFDTELDNDACRWLRTADVPPLASARLYRWEAHTFALTAWIDSMGGTLAALRSVDAIPGLLARTTLWRGISEAVMFWRYRDLLRYKRDGHAELALFCVSQIDTDVGRHAARILVALVEGAAVPTSVVRDGVLDRIADTDAPTREYAARIVRLDGVPEIRAVDPASPAVLAEIRACRDADQLARWCEDPRTPVVSEAALALSALGPEGQQRLAAMLASPAALVVPVPILATISVWDDPVALAQVRTLAARADLPASWQFYLCLNIAWHGDRDAAQRALDAVRIPATDWFFRREDWDALIQVIDPATCAFTLADAPHHHAYQRSVALLLAMTRHSPEAGEALRRFLEVDGDRPLHLRVAAAIWLAENMADHTGLPLLASYDGDEWKKVVDLLPQVVPLVADAALIGGEGVVSEKHLVHVLGHARGKLAPEVQSALDLRVLEEASTALARREAASHAVGEMLAYGRLARVAEVFAWGVRRGVELTGRLLRFHMTSKETDFGHTRLDTSKIFVSALPMLRDETNGQDIVEGLVLHEIGHHVYHRGEVEQALWKRAHAEGIGHLLNLIADEHLERNLRALNPAYGDRLKRLGAYAFQHAPQEIPLATLLASLRGGAARALSATPLDVAFDEASVRLRRGAVIGELDKAGHPLARFARALRLGLGNRHNDPRIAQALALCKDVRSLDMQGLYDLTRAIADLFGGAVQLAQVFGGPEGLEFGERDDDVFGAGVDDDILQREVERILDPRGGDRKNREKAGPRDRLCINVNEASEFDRIHKVERVHGDAAAHKTHALAVSRHAARLRSFLDELGLRWVPDRARTSGRALDRTRLRALVTRGDPKILIARRPVRRTDLFLGVVVDCSGSMQAGDNIDRARRFAILVAEAVRPLPGVHARFFGFTDDVIYDAGNAQDCDVVALEAGGGNNDAAALWYAANVALAAPQRAKVLVMLSDGLPTECSVAALRNLVTELTNRRGIVCAQIALRKLEEVCFPHYVVLDDHELDVAVAKFGRMIGDLARRVL
jgi:hypothetical protein